MDISIFFNILCQNTGNSSCIFETQFSRFDQTKTKIDPHTKAPTDCHLHALNISSILMKYKRRYVYPIHEHFHIPFINKKALQGIQCMYYILEVIQ